MTTHSLSARGSNARLASASLTVALLATAACSDSTGPGPRVPSRVVLSADSVAVGTGDTIRLGATVLDANDRVVRDAAVRWRSLNTARASVDPVTGLATGGGIGNVEIVAQSGELADTVLLVVTRRVASVTLTFAPESIFVASGTTAASAIAYDAGGVKIDGAPILWTTADTSIVRVSASGGVSAADEGEAELRATSGSVIARKTVRARFRQLRLGTLRPATVAMGRNNACALDAEGRAYCWGNNLANSLGRSDPLSNFTVPGEVAGGHRFVAIDANDATGCGLTATGRLLCWGRNSMAPRNSSMPTPILDSIPTVAFAVGMHNQSCALGNDGEVRCWGHNDTYQLGRGPLSGYDTLALPVAGGQRFKGSVALGGFGGCALGADDAAWCWGDGGQPFGQPEDRAVRIPSSPALVQVESFAQSAACGRTAAGEVWCWGTSFDLGASESPAPVRVTGIPPVQHLDGGWDVMCGMAADGSVWCWSQSTVLGPTGQAGTTARSWRFARNRHFRSFFVSENNGVCGIQQDETIVCAGSIIATSL